MFFLEKRREKEIKRESERVKYLFYVIRGIINKINFILKEKTRWSIIVDFIYSYKRELTNESKMFLISNIFSLSFSF